MLRSKQNLKDVKTVQSQVMAAEKQSNILFCYSVFGGANRQGMDHNVPKSTIKPPRRFVSAYPI